MHFKFLSEVGEHYATETTAHLLHGKVAPQMPLRMVALRGLAAGLLKAKTEYERLDRPHPRLRSDGVRRSPSEGHCTVGASSSLGVRG